MSEKGVDSVDRALSILQALLGSGPSMSLHELAKATGLYKSTILRLIVSLEKAGYLRRGEDLRYRLGPTCAALGSAYRSAFDLSDLIRPAVAEMAQRSGESASFYIRDGESRICLYRRNSNQAIRHHIDEGDRLPIRAGAAGAVLIAFSERDDPASVRIRSQGYAVSLGERDLDAAAVAAPVLDSDGRLVGALTISGLRTRFTPEAVDDYCDILLDVISGLGVITLRD